MRFSAQGVPVTNGSGMDGLERRTGRWRDGGILLRAHQGTCRRRRW
jgi:hypothetical protein